jgi:hypothetical protein
MLRVTIPLLCTLGLLACSSPPEAPSPDVAPPTPAEPATKEEAPQVPVEASAITWDDATIEEGRLLAQATLDALEAGDAEAVLATMDAALAAIKAEEIRAALSTGELAFGSSDLTPEQPGDCGYAYRAQIRWNEGGEARQGFMDLEVCQRGEALRVTTLESH